MVPFICFSLAVLTVVLLAIFGLVRTASAVEPGNPSPPPPPITAAAVKGLDKAKLDRLLSRLERAPEPATKMGAMCYDMAGPPDTVNYICPICHAKTVYALGTNSTNFGQVWLVAYELATARRLAGQIRTQSPGIQLDESSLCHRCSPAATNRTIVLHLTFADGSTRDVAPRTVDDLQILGDFLAGRRESPTRNDGTVALKATLPRLRELLGFAPPATNAPAARRTLTTGN